MSNLSTSQKLIILAIAWLLLRGGGITTVGPQAVTQVTYVHVPKAAIPSPVLAHLNTLNRREPKILATPFAHNTTDGDSQVPDQYKVAVAAAKKLPSLVVQSGANVVKVVEDPKTDDDMQKAVP